MRKWLISSEWNTPFSLSYHWGIMMKSSFAYICWSRTANLPGNERIEGRRQQNTITEMRQYHISKCLRRIDLCEICANDNPVSKSISTSNPFVVWSLHTRILITFQIIMAPIQFSASYLLFAAMQSCKRGDGLLPGKSVLCFLVNANIFLLLLLFVVR